MERSKEIETYKSIETSSRRSQPSFSFYVIELKCLLWFHTNNIPSNFCGDPRDMEPPQKYAKCT